MDSLQNIIKCNDGMLAITTQDLRVVFEKMPTLQYVLLGHPNMMGSRITVEHSTQMMTINEEWGILKQPLGQVLSCALGSSTSLPEGQDDRALLIQHLEMLGGFDILNSLLRTEKERADEAEQLSRRQASVSPVTDIWEMFHWRSAGPLYAHQPIDGVDAFYAEGFVYVGAEKVGCSTSGNTSVMHHFRRKRS